MKRRTFIKLTIIGSAGALLSFLVLDFKRTVKMILVEDTKHLNFLTPHTITLFLNEANAEQFWNQFSTAKRLFISIQHNFYSLHIHLPYQSKYLQYRSVITGHLLLSTDFFTERMNTNRKIKYNQFYNPYRQPCYNPFSSIYYPEKA